MAKSVMDAVRRQAAQSHPQTEDRQSAVGCGVVGFRKVYSQDEWNQIEVERAAMRERLTSED